MKGFVALAMALPAALVAFSFYLLAVGFAAPPDPARMTKQPAVVRYVSSATDEAEVAYDDGLHVVTMTMRELPAAEERVLLERAGGKAMSLWDPVTERRYRANAWPVRWSMQSFGVPLLLLAIGLFVVGGFGREVRRTR